MAKKATSRTRKKALTAKDLGVYINLLTDFGFTCACAQCEQADF